MEAKAKTLESGLADKSWSKKKRKIFFHSRALGISVFYIVYHKERVSTFAKDALLYSVGSYGG